MDFPTYVPSGLLIWVENPKYKYFCYNLNYALNRL